MNEGHAALLAVELLDGSLASSASGEAVEAAREKCVFTTHTPVPAGHDRFPIELARQVLGPITDLLERSGHDLLADGFLNMTHLALNLSRYVNGVAKRHRDISSAMFAGYTVDAITNGVHAATWTSRPFQDLFDAFIPGWREDNFSLRYALGIAAADVWAAHTAAKAELLNYVSQTEGSTLDREVLTLGFGRRATGEGGTSSAASSRPVRRLHLT